MQLKQSSTIQAEPGRKENSANALGWFSIGLGLAEVAAPRGLARLIGVRNRPVLMRILGAREIVSGIGILARPRPTRWLWARVAGDAVDLALLAGAFNTRKTKRERVGGAIAAVAGVTALDVLLSRRLSRDDGSRTGHGGAIHVSKSMVVNRPADEVYRFWRDIENLPRFMNHLESVRVTGDQMSHWVAKAPAGKSVEWDAEILVDRPNEEIAWRSLEGADIFNSGSVRFKAMPGGRGTKVDVELEYVPPGGMIGAVMAKVFGEEPEQQVREDLRRFKQIIETGEAPTTEGQSSGTRSLTAAVARSLNPAAGRAK
jgi:uncharacterized membrane protein